MGIFGSGRTYKPSHQQRHHSSSAPPSASLIAQRKYRPPHKKPSSSPLSIKRLKERIARSQSRHRSHASAATTFYAAHHRPGTSFLLLNHKLPSDICFHRVSTESSSSSSSTESLVLPSSSHTASVASGIANSNCTLNPGSSASQSFRIHPIYVRKQRTATNLVSNSRLLHVPRPVHAGPQGLALQHQVETDRCDSMDLTPSLSTTSSRSASSSSSSSLSVPSTPTSSVETASYQQNWLQPLSSHTNTVGNSKSPDGPQIAASSNTMTGLRSDLKPDPFGQLDTNDAGNQIQRTHLQQQHEHLQLLKREAFQELASQTQRNNDIFIAKMIYWESLSAEERAQCPLALDITEQENPVPHGMDSTNNDPEIAMASLIDRDDMDELVSALECHATVKDYSDLIAFEQQAELERLKRQHQRRRHQQQHWAYQDPSAWEYEYEDSH